MARRLRSNNWLAGHAPLLAGGPYFGFFLAGVDRVFPLLQEYTAGQINNF